MEEENNAIEFEVTVDPEFENLIPPPNEQEFAGLEAAVLRDGCTDPLIVWKGHGILIDGHNRKKICDKYNVPYKTSELPFDSRENVKRWIIERQFGRRNLMPFQRAELALLLKPLLAEEAKKRQGARNDLMNNIQPSEGGMLNGRETRDVLAHNCRVSKNTIDKADFIKQHADDETLDRLRRGDVAIKSEYHRLKKEVNQMERAERKAAPVVIPNDEKIRLEVCDIADAATNVEPESVDFIITDPPYPEKYLPTFGQLADFAATTLKPGGSLICMSGQSYLPEVYRLLTGTPDLKFHWELSYLTPGGQATQLWERKVNTFWKPLLWFVKGKYSGDWIGDVVKSAPNDNDKAHHHWGQSVSGMRDLLDRFVLPGKIVCDPFLGGGTTAIAARQCNCRFIGFDIDEKCLETTRQRLAELATEENHG